MTTGRTVLTADILASLALTTNRQTTGCAQKAAKVSFKREFARRQRLRATPQGERSDETQQSACTRARSMAKRGPARRAATANLTSSTQSDRGAKPSWWAKS